MLNTALGEDPVNTDAIAETTMPETTITWTEATTADPIVVHPPSEALS